MSSITVKSIIDTAELIYKHYCSDSSKYKKSKSAKFTLKIPTKEFNILKKEFASTKENHWEYIALPSQLIYRFETNIKIEHYQFHKSNYDDAIKILPGTVTAFVDFFFKNGNFSHRNFDSSKAHTPVFNILKENI